MLIDRVATAIKEVAAAEVLPRFRALTDGDVSEKSPGDYVTIADQECERVLSERLRQIRDLPVVGEEATAEDPELLNLVEHAEAAWIIDPIDGTSNFVAGKTDFVVMVALVEAGDATAAWVWHPERNSMLTAKRGEGIHRDGVRLRPVPNPAAATGIVKRRYVPEPGRTALGNFPREVGELVHAQGSAGIEYASLIDGEIDFLFYWRTLPWDHAPCGLLAAEAGMKVARPDGIPYRPGDGRTGLLAARPEVWESVAHVIHTATHDIPRQ